MDDKFDWSSADVVVRSVRALAVYQNPDGDTVIRQQGDDLHDSDPFVVIPRERVEEIITAIREAAATPMTD